VSANVDPIEPGASAPAMSVEESDTVKKGRMEIVLERSRRIVVFADVDIEALSRVLRVVERT
jgi:hypothetical protein